jgi:hypothetical protein
MSKTLYLILCVRDAPSVLIKVIHNECLSSAHFACLLTMSYTGFAFSVRFYKLLRKLLCDYFLEV